MSEIFRLEAPYRGAYTLHRLQFGSGSPTVALVAGVHGNEVNSTYALNLIANTLRMAAPRGTVSLLPCVNSFGADEGRKRWPFDDRDIALAFPGDPDGNAVDRIAAAVMDATEADVCVDVHSGGTTQHELPHVRTPLQPRALDLARAAALPVTWRRPSDKFDDGLVGAWRDAGRVAFQVRGGRGATLDVDDARVMARGLLRMLAAMGLVGAADPPGPHLETDRVRDYRTGAGGFFVPEVHPGARVSHGTLLGTVRAPLGGEPIETVVAERSGVVIGVRIYPMVHARELAVRVAEESG